MLAEGTAAASGQSQVPLPFAGHPGPGALISIDGLDGTGKTTLVQQLAELLTRSGLHVLKVRFPTDRMRRSDSFQLVTAQQGTAHVDPLAFEIEYMVDRIQHCKMMIEPALRVGSWVVADRYALSSIGTLLLRMPGLYRTAVSAIASEAWFRDLCRYLVRPDIALMLRVDPDVALRRLQSRPGETDGAVQPAQYEKLQQFAIEVARANGISVINANVTSESLLTKCTGLIADWRARREGCD